MNDYVEKLNDSIDVSVPPEIRLRLSEKEWT